MDEYKERKPGLEKHRLGPSIIEVYGMQYQQLIADQIYLFIEESEMMDQMQVVCDKREHLFNLSMELFLRYAGLTFFVFWIWIIEYWLFFENYL